MYKQFWHRIQSPPPPKWYLRLGHVIQEIHGEPLKASPLGSQGGLTSYFLFVFCFVVVIFHIVCSQHKSAIQNQNTVNAASLLDRTNNCFPVLQCVDDVIEQHVWMLCF